MLVTDTNGAIKYKREYTTYTPNYAQSNLLLHSAVTPYNTIVFSGSATFRRTVPGVVDTLGDYGWLIQTDALGCLTPGCDTAKTAGVPDPTLSLEKAQVYPNPTNGTLYLKDLPAGGCQYSLLDATGRTLRRGRFSQQRETISLSDLPAGLYLLQLREASGGMQHFKVVKE